MARNTLLLDSLSYFLSSLVSLLAICSYFMDLFLFPTLLLRFFLNQPINLLPILFPETTAPFNDYF